MDDVSNSPGKKKGNEKERNNAEKGTEIDEAEAVEKDDATYPKIEGIVAVEVEENGEDRSAKTEAEAENKEAGINTAEGNDVEEGADGENEIEGDEEEEANEDAVVLGEENTDVGEEEVVEKIEEEAEEERTEEEEGGKENVISEENYELLSVPLGNVKKETGAEERLMSNLGRMKTLGQKVEERETNNNRVGLSNELVSSGSSNGHGHYMQSTLLVWADFIEDAWPKLSKRNNRSGLKSLGPRNYTQTWESILTEGNGSDDHSHAKGSNEGGQEQGTSIVNAADANQSGARFRQPSPEEMAERWRHNPLGTMKGSSTQDSDDVTEAMYGSEWWGMRFWSPDERAGKSRSNFRVVFLEIEAADMNLEKVNMVEKEEGEEANLRLTIYSRVGIIFDSSLQVRKKGNTESSHNFLVVGIAQELKLPMWSRSFKQWDPGGSFFTLIVLFLHLEDKVNLKGGVLMGL